MNSEPLVSVITIFLNGESFIVEAIESVLAQTYSTWELLLVDDGSNDGSSKIAISYADRYPDKVKYLEHQNHANRGMSATRNLGISHASGKYVAFLDADDFWYPTKLQEQVAILEANPEAVMLYGNTQYWYSWQEGNQVKDFIPGLKLISNQIYNPPRLLPLYIDSRLSTPCTCSIILRRDKIEDIGYFEESFRGMNEDQAFYAKVCLQAPVYVSDRCWDRYRQHADSQCNISESHGETQILRFEYLSWLENYLIEKRITDNEIWVALHREKWRLHYPRWLKPSGSGRRYLGRLKKWILKFENIILPIFVQNWIWRPGSR